VRAGDGTEELFRCWICDVFKRDQLKAWVLYIYGEGGERPLRRQLGSDGESGEERASHRESGKIKATPPARLTTARARRRRARGNLLYFLQLLKLTCHQPIN
jgi:hypothetical protein